MNSTRRLQAAVVGLIGVAFAVVWIARDGDEPAPAFAPYEESGSAPTDPPAAAQPTSAAPAPAASAAAPAAVPARTAPATADREEDTLNRPGPDGTPDGRRITNRRPREGGDETAGPAEPAPGTLDKDSIRKGIRAVTPMVKVCYEETLEEFPDAAGKVTIGFRIIGEDGKGRVEMSELDQEGTTLFDEKLHDCLQNRVAEAEFEAPEGGGVVNVRYPFVFATDAEEE